jgi:hypothetical protein
MDFDGAIQAHTDWKLRIFRRCRGKPAEKTDGQTPRKENAGTQGEWLPNDTGAYAADPKFKQLQEMHSASGKCAAAIEALLDSGQAAAAGALVASQESEINRLSMGMVGLLMDLRERYSGA